VSAATSSSRGRHARHYGFISHRTTDRPNRSSSCTLFTFANILANVASAKVTSGTGTVSSSAIGSDTHQYVVNLTGVANAQVIPVSLTNVYDSAGNRTAAISAPMGVLLGDTTGDNSVNSADISQTKSQSGNPVTNSNFA
jgi:hypothetical protein